MTSTDSLTALRGTVGLWTMYLEALEPRDAAALAADIEEWGYHSLWFPEAWGREAFTNAALLLSATDRLVVATGIANIWARDAVTAANASKTLGAVSGDRFVLGLGVSHEPLVSRLRGHDYRTPVATMSDYLDAMDKAPMLAPESGVEVPRLLAALGPKMLDLAAAKADGAHTYLVNPAHTREARSRLGAGFLVVEQPVVLGQDREEYLRRAHEHLEIYTGLPNYRNNWRRLGFTDDDVVRGGSEALCDALVIHGDTDAIADSIAAHREAGADHVILQVLGPDLATPPIAEWRELAERLV